ncbi:MAG: dTDP-4-dehydrorhamnose 3,5-epimerase [Acidimicrobiia bacterium]
MKFSSTAIDGVHIIELERFNDHRGFFARVWSEEDFAPQGLADDWKQCNVGHSESPGTVRGLHFQTGDLAEAKLVWCTAGSVFDVAVDLRDDSPTRGQWVGTELSATNGTMLYMPPGTAHGYQALEAGTDLWYLSNEPYSPEAATGARWDDPAFGISWPLPPGPMSEQDSSWPLQEGVEQNDHR